jgi:2-dehydropantoate 2-reductase
MRVGVIGFGVIGTIYGCVLAEAGHDVVHYVRPGRTAARRAGAEVRLLDARGGEAKERRMRYQPELVEGLDGIDVDVVLTSVPHYQLGELLPLLANSVPAAELLFFGNLWTSFEPVDPQLRGRYMWGFPVAGDGFEKGVLEAALLPVVQLGIVPGVDRSRLEPLIDLFSGCGLEVEVQPDMLAWLWTHFAVEAGVIATAIKAGGVAKFLSDVERIREAVLAVRDALAVVEARRIDPRSVPDVQMFFAPERDVAEAIRELYASDRAARKIMERHTGRDELQRIYRDVLSTGRELGVQMRRSSRSNPS